MEAVVLNLRRHADALDDASLSNRLRQRRFALFERLITGLDRPVRILDIGGTVAFWQHRGWTERSDCEITLLNLEAEESPYSHIRSTVGSATSMPEYGDNSFDIAFSNSVIEHLFTLANQRMMASEVLRVAKGYWVQTPNYWFPIEPHFHVPGWQWMPEAARIALLQRFRCGWRGPCPNREEAAKLVREVRLMTRRELRDCFPGAHLYAEHFQGLVKSWVAIGGTLRQAFEQRPVPETA